MINHLQRYLHQTVAMILTLFFIFLTEERESLILHKILLNSLNLVADHIRNYGTDIKDILERKTVRRNKMQLVKSRHQIRMYQSK